MRSVAKYILLSVAALVIGCGNPVTLEKDLRREEEKRKSAEEQSTALNTEVGFLKAFLTNIYVSENHLWLFAGFYSSYDSARAQCEHIGYTLPSAEAFEEFKTEVLPRRAEWATMDTKQFQIEGRPSDSDSGIVLCRTTRK